MRSGNTKPDVIAKITPWVTNADRSALIAAFDAQDVPPILFNDVEKILSSKTFANKGFDANVFQFIVSNGYYGSLALNNHDHFKPENWNAFEFYQRAALNLIDTYITSTSPRPESAPIPADAVAFCAGGLHFLTDAYSAGHMRVPRQALTQKKTSLLSKLMHDLEGKVGLTVSNGFGQKWRAFGDGNLKNLDDENQQTILRGMSAGGVNTNPRANMEQAIGAVSSAMLQLHYHAQKYLNDAERPEVQGVLTDHRLSAGIGRLRHDNFALHGTPGEPDQNIDQWLAMDINAKLAYMRKHQPVPLPEAAAWQIGSGNHPPLCLPDGSINTSGGYRWVKHKLKGNNDRALRMNGFSSDIDFTKPFQLERNMPQEALAWFGTATLEKGLQLLCSTLPED
jgi:hypothetical protein